MLVVMGVFGELRRQQQLLRTQPNLVGSISTVVRLLGVEFNDGVLVCHPAGEMSWASI
jgi:hypothetical protein